MSIYRNDSIRCNVYNIIKTKWSLDTFCVFLNYSFKTKNKQFHSVEVIWIYHCTKHNVFSLLLECHILYEKQILSSKKTEATESDMSKTSLKIVSLFPWFKCVFYGFRDMCKTSRFSWAKHCCNFSDLNNLFASAPDR